MKKLGIDMGTSTIKLVLIQDDTVEKKILRKHHGRLIRVLRSCLDETGLAPDDSIHVMVTGANASALTSRLPALDRLGDIPSSWKA